MKQRYTIILVMLSLSLLNLEVLHAQVFINEIHYDNMGEDSREAIEFAGPAGSDLTGYTIAFYDGLSGRVYDQFTISVVIPAQENGYGTVAVFRRDIENGAPDGIALIDNFGQVLQFISYEGSFVAIDGPAAGAFTSDIGVKEDETTFFYESLQLIGEGSEVADFSWVGPKFNSMGRVNDEQSFVDLEPIEITINEIRIDQPSGANEAYFELAGDPGASLNGLTYLVVGNDGVVQEAINLENQVIPLSGFFVAANADFSLTAADFTTQFSLETESNVTHLLVEDFTGSIGDDLDDSNNGAFDVTPWERILDDVAIEKDNSITYSSNQAGPDGNFIPAHVAKDGSGNFVVGNFDTSQSFDTPGLANSFTVVAPEGASVEGFVAINPYTKEEAAAFSFDAPTNLAQYQLTNETSKFTIQAVVSQSDVKRVEFVLNGEVQKDKKKKKPKNKKGKKYDNKEDESSFYLFGDDKKKKIGYEHLEVGDYELTATPYTLDSAGEANVAGVSRTIRFSVIQGTLDITNFFLVDAETNERIEQIVDGQEIDLAAYDNEFLNIEAIPNPEKVGEIEFQLNTPQKDFKRKAKEEGAYTLFKPYKEPKGKKKQKGKDKKYNQDKHGKGKGKGKKDKKKEKEAYKYAKYIETEGDYLLEATPVAVKGKHGVRGATATLHFSIINSATPVENTRTLVAAQEQIQEEPAESFMQNELASFLTYPNPSPGEVHFYYEGDADQMIELRVYDPIGNLVYQQDAQGELDEVVSLHHLKDGWYIVNLVTSHQRFSQKLILE